MKDPYLYLHTDILKNLADIRDREMLSCMEAEYTSIRLAELVTGESVSRFDLQRFVICIIIFFRIFMNGQEKSEL